MVLESQTYSVVGTADRRLMDSYVCSIESALCNRDPHLLLALSVDMNEGFAASTKYNIKSDIVFIQEANSCLYHLVKVRPVILFCMQDIDHAINQLSDTDTKVGRAKSRV